MCFPKCPWSKRDLKESTWIDKTNTSRSKYIWELDSQMSFCCKYLLYKVFLSRSNTETLKPYSINEKYNLTNILISVCLSRHTTVHGSWNHRQGSPRIRQASGHLVSGLHHHRDGHWEATFLWTGRAAGCHVQGETQQRYRSHHPAGY